MSQNRLFYHSAPSSGSNSPEINLNEQNNQLNLMTYNSQPNPNHFTYQNQYSNQNNMNNINNNNNNNRINRNNISNISNSSLSYSNLNTSSTLNYLDLLSKYNQIQNENIQLKLKITELQMNNGTVELCKKYLAEKNNLQKQNNNLLSRNKKVQNKYENEKYQKRCLLHMVHKYGISNRDIRKYNGDFTYGADVRYYKYNEITKLPTYNNVEQFKLGSNKQTATKYFEFTSSGSKSLRISDLRVICETDPDEIIRFKITKLSASFESIQNDIDIDLPTNLNLNLEEDLKDDSNSESSETNKSDTPSKSSLIIYPDDHFSVEFDHKIRQKIGNYHIKYRLFSIKKSKSNRYNGVGRFGQIIEFKYQVNA